MIVNKPNLRILALGDSITYGYLEESGNSYRRGLECLLYQGGVGVQYIGSIKNGNWPDNANDGFPGQRIDQIGPSAYPEIIGPLKPNVILIHAGTNDMIQNFDVVNAPARLGNLITNITFNNPDAVIFVAQIIVNGDVSVNARVNEFNRQLPGIVSTNGNARIVSMQEVTVEDLVDGTHPNQKGYMKMASAWYKALVQAGNDRILKPISGPFTDGGPSSVPAGGGECITMISPIAAREHEML